MKRHLSFALGASLLTAMTVGLFWSGSPPHPAARAAEGEGQKSEAAPVEEDMHEFMEYVFQPTYQRLKTQIASQPADNQAWKGIKSDALILAEGGNLLLIRKAEEDQADWNQHSLQVRDLGGQLYRAAKAKDLQASRRHYEAMLTHCNACHQQFAGGEHQLKP
jgi:hypothetical protein